MARLAAMLEPLHSCCGAIGLFGLLAGEVARRTPEIGLRIALGAELGHVRWMVIRQSLLVIAAGLSFGIPAAIGGTRVLGALLFGLSPADPASLAIAAALIVVVGGIAAYLPARRASRRRSGAGDSDGVKPGGSLRFVPAARYSLLQIPALGNLPAHGVGLVQLLELFAFVGRQFDVEGR